MDRRTLDAYQAGAERLTATYRSVTPIALQQQMLAFFHPGGSVADVGCGSGRDAAWLAERDFSVVGFDGSPAMLAEARKHYPHLRFEHALLPELEAIRDEAFANVLCSATLMHVGREHLITAVINLARILKPSGRLIVSYRSSSGGDEREDDGRLFTAIPPGKLALLFEASGLQVVERLTQPDTSRPGLEWTVLLAEKGIQGDARGLERVQSVLAQDKKDATYKFALMRALCNISRTQSNLVLWGPGEVYVPLWSVAALWLEYYWPFLTSPAFVAQKRGEGPASQKRVAFRGVVDDLAAEYGAGGLGLLQRRLMEEPGALYKPLRKIADTIRDGPVVYSGSGSSPVFRHVPRGLGGGLEDSFGWIAVPEPIWLDISRFSHWIEDSLILRWAQLTAEMNADSMPATYIPFLLPQDDERDTTEVRGLLTDLGQPLECVWSGASLTRGFEVDHVIPWAAWGNNDWWNLLPASPTLNREKSDSLPTRALLLRRRDEIIGYWRVYERVRPERFGRQVGRALGVAVGQGGWEGLAFAGLQEAVERVAVQRGLRRWEP